MKTAIYATLFHSISTDQKPQHFKCLTGKDSWCFFQASLARGAIPGPHVKHVKTPLKETHLAKSMPLYQRLASNELLQRCIRCVTQNSNESLHSIIRKFSKGKRACFKYTVKNVGCLARLPKSLSEEKKKIGSVRNCSEKNCVSKKAAKRLIL
ncbi:uncharacterized protein TNCV_350611 [Trichonephila clavipes]|nr:uncharacterized protein TNCV_350611 [Trichonephila clavipes]